MQRYFLLLIFIVTAFPASASFAAGEKPFTRTYPFETARIELNYVSGGKSTISVKDGIVRIDGGPKAIADRSYTIQKGGLIYQVRPGQPTLKSVSYNSYLDAAYRVLPESKKGKMRRALINIGPHLPYENTIAHDSVTKTKDRDMSGQQAECYLITSKTPPLASTEFCVWNGFELYRRHQKPDTGAWVVDTDTSSIKTDIPLDDSLFAIPGAQSATFSEDLSDRENAAKDTIVHILSSGDKPWLGLFSVLSP